VKVVLAVESARAGLKVWQVSLPFRVGHVSNGSESAAAAASQHFLCQSSPPLPRRSRKGVDLARWIDWRWRYLRVVLAMVCLHPSNSDEQHVPDSDIPTSRFKLDVDALVLSTSI
jgi:hypothetical protein